MWASEGDGEWLQMTFRKPFMIDHIKMAFQPSQRYESYFEILGSTDGITFEPILEKTFSCSFSGNIQVFRFPLSKTETPYSIIKWIGHCNASNNWNYISEIKFCGYYSRQTENDAEKQVTVYPNPANNFIRISFKKDTIFPTFILISNMYGQIVYEDKLINEKGELYVPLNLNNGLYIIKMGYGDIVRYNCKLIVKN